MNIRIQVLANQARKAIRDVEGDMSRLSAATAAGGASTEGFARRQDNAFKAMNKWGNQLQWTGRQLQYNWTLPIAVAGAAATKFALDQDRAMTRVTKVYGEAGMAVAQKTKELGALERAFTALSNRYGIAIDETTNIAAEWAAAGASGLALAKNTELTMKTMVLGEMEAAEATEALVAIQAQYDFTADQLGDTLSRLNAIENQTGTTTQDLVVAFSRAAGMARVTGVDVQHLGAMIAALTPAAGTASQAGNALKTIFQRLFSPTRESAQILNEIGIATADVAWQTANATGRLQTISDKWETLSDSQRSVVASTLAGIYQGNKFVVLMEEMGSETGYYSKALKAAADDADYFKVANDELMAVLGSDAQRWKQAGVIIQNSMIKVIQPLLPMIIGLAQEVANLANSFAQLDPNLQKLIMFGLVFLALIGPLVRYVGSLFTLFGVLGRAVFSTAAGFGALAGMLGLTGGAAQAAAASTAAAAATSAAAAATATGAAGAVSGGFLSRLAGGIRKGAVQLDKAFSSAMGRQVGVTQAGLQKIKATYNLNLGALKFIAGAQLSSLTGTMTAGATSAATGFAGVMRAILAPSLGQSILTMGAWGLVAMNQVGTTVSGSAAVAGGKIRTTLGAALGNMAYDMRRYGAIAGDKLSDGLRSMFPKTVATQETINGGIIGGAMRLGAELPMIWASAVGRVEQVYYGHRIRLLGMMEASNNATLVATATYGRAYGTLYGRLLFPAQVATQRLGETLPGMHTRMWARIQAITARGALVMTELGMARDANLIGRQGATGGILTRLWAGTQARMSAISTVGQARLTAISAAGHTRLIALQIAAEGRIAAVAAAGSARLVAIKGAMLGKLRAMWMAFVAFLSSPAALMAAFKRMGTVVAAGGKGILGLFATISKGALALLTSPWGLVIAAVVAFIVIFRDQLKQVWENIVAYFGDANNAIVQTFNALPEGVKNAITKVVAIVRAAALKVYEWFSYLNPFAHHSPSLVENVTNGMAAVRSQFGTLTQISGPISQAYASIKRLKDLTADLRNGETSLQIAEDIEKLGKSAPHAIGAYRQLQAILGTLTAQQDRLSDAVATQEQRTNALKAAVDASNAALDRQKDILSELENVAQAYQDSISTLRGEISELASTPITGMGAMDDALFNNEMAQKRLRLEIMRMEDAGQTYDDVKNKVAELNGEMDMLRGERENMRAMGAGSDILGFYDDQIKKLEQQKDAVDESTAPIQEMTNQLEALAREAERMDLEKALAFDPLTRQIEKAANGMEEMPFDLIIGKINQNQAAIDSLEGAYATANDAVTRQKAVVDQAQAAHDALSASYDLENEKLEALRDAYSQVSDAISDVNSSLSDMRGSADSAIKAAEDAAGGAESVSPALQNFRDASGGDFAEVGGLGKIGREGPEGDQSGMIDDWTANVEQQMADAFGGLDMFGPIKEMWNKLVKWWDANVGPWITAIGSFFSTVFDGVDFFGPIKAKFDEVWKKVFGTAFSDVDWGKVGENIANGIRTALGVLATIGKWLWDLFGEELLDTFAIIWDWLQKTFADIGDIFSQVLDRIGPFLEAVRNLAMIIGAALAPVVVWLIAVLQVVWSVLNGMLGPILGWIVGVFKNLWQIILGVIDVFIGLFTLDFGTFFSGLGNILGGLGGLIWDTIVSLGAVIWGALKGLVTGLWDSFMWVGKMIWEGLEAGLNAIGLGWIVDIFGGIIDWVKDLFGIASPSKVFSDIGGWLMEGLGAGIQAAWNVVSAVFTFIFNLIKGIFETIGTIVFWLWNNVFSPVFTFIGGIITWVWSSIIQPVIGFIIAYIQIWAAIIGWLWDNVIKPVFGFIGEIFSWIWNSVISPIFGFIGAAFEVLGAVFQWVWEKVLKPNIDFWWGLISWVWENVMGPIFGLIGGAFEVLGAVFQWVWEKILKPNIDFWWGLIQWVWDKIMKPIFGFIGGAFEVLGDIIAWVWNNIIKPAWSALETAIGWLWNNILKPIFDAIGVAWDALGTGLGWVYDHIIKPMFDAFSKVVEAIKNSFDTAVGFIVSIWDTLKEALMAPVRVVVDTVWNNGLRKLWNWINNLWGGDDIGEFKLAKGGIFNGGGGSYAQGGVMPGYSPGRDIHTFVSPTGGKLHLSGGEAVMRPEFTRAMGKHGVNMLNKAARSGGAQAVANVLAARTRYDQKYADGGIIDMPGWVDWTLGILPGGGIIKDTINSINGTDRGSGNVAEMLVGTVKKTWTDVWDYVKEWWDGDDNQGQGGFSGKASAPGRGGLGPMAAAARSFVMQTFGLTNIGGYANRNVAGTGVKSDHALGKAIDVMIPNYKSAQGIAMGDAVAKWFIHNPGRFGTKYVIWRDRINEGHGWKPYRHPGGGSSDTLQHRDHDHVSFFDKGGVAGGVGYMNKKTIMPERVLSPRQTVAFERLVAILDASGVPSVASMEAAIFRAEARANQAETIGSQTIIHNEGDTNITMHFHGDLSFPNIKDGDDADVFLQNLGDLAGGGRR